MFLPTTDLDDTRWSELVEEGRALIPLYAPEWTDHNYSDPGITFAELFAWLAEMQVFQVDQVPERHRRKFLALVGIEPLPPQPARTVVRFGLPAGAPALDLPATIECEGRDPAGTAVRVRTLRALHVVPVTLAAIAARSDAGTQDLTARWRRGEAFAPFGDDPRLGATLELGLDASPPQGVATTIALTCATDRAGEAERARLRDVAALGRGACRPPDSLVACDDASPASADEPEATPRHHSARVVWELQVAKGRWRTLDPAAGEVVDDTRALTLDGQVDIVAPQSMYADDADGAQHFLLRCRFAHGAYDEAPLLRDIAVNGVAAEQSVPAVASWQLAANAVVVGTPEPGRTQRLGIELDAFGTITRLDLTEEGAPAVLVLGYGAPPQGGPVVLTVEALRVGRGDGAPGQIARLDPAPVEAASVRLWTGHGPTWRRWSVRRDLDASGPGDTHVVLDAEAGVVGFGDGVHGLVAPAGDLIVAAYRTTLAQGGNLTAAAIDRLADDDHNRALLAGAPKVDVTNPVPATGGAAAETLAHAEGRAGELTTQVTRAVTLTDYERLALETPGGRLARASARANAHPGFPCVVATGVVTVAVVPHLPPDRPVPSAGLLRAVAAYLDPRRIVGTRFEVTGPTYTEVRVRARVRATRLADTTEVGGRIVGALDAFFHPLHGGPDGAGWPLGRDVVRSEVLQEIDDVTGVDHVLALDLIGPDGASCGNLCVGPLGLVAAAGHEIEVVRA
jgi:Baseplate J-like protein